MRIENQCCTLEQAIRLKEFGVEQNSYFYFARFIDNLSDFKIRFHEWLFFHQDREVESIASFTVAELGLMLPIFYPSYKGRNEINVCIEIPYQTEDSITADDLQDAVEAGKHTTATTEAEARAAMLIHLLENNLITAEEVNKRLVNEEQKQTVS